MDTTSPSLSVKIKCPYCGQAVMHTERRPNGNSTCISGHIFKTSEGIIPFSTPFNTNNSTNKTESFGVDTIDEFNQINERLKLLNQYLEVNLGSLTPIRRSRLLNMRRYMSGYLSMLQEEIEETYAHSTIRYTPEG